MAMTSRTYSSTSLIPTSTLASASSTPTNGPDDTIADLFSSNGSPPLIVAFLAIGLFVVAIVCVFGWRRLLHSRGRGGQPTIPNYSHKTIPLGERPMLWDVLADPTAPSEATRWENITPMTATLTFPSPPIQPPPVDPLPIEPVPGHMHFRMLKSLLSAVKRFYFPVPPPPPPPPPSEEKEVVPPSLHASDAVEWGDASSSLQVSVIITMPTQRRCCGGKETDPERMELGEFCIGTMDVP